MKTCTKCEMEKPKHEFWKHALKSDGLSSNCKACASEYRAIHRGEIAAKKMIYRAKNKEAIRANNALYRANNPDKARVYRATYESKNPSYQRIKCHNRRARIRANGMLSVGIARRLYELQRGKCACGCKQPLGVDYHLDHVLPLALGGPNTDDNMQLLRSTCNQQKHAKHPVDFMQERGFLI